MTCCVCQCSLRKEPGLAKPASSPRCAATAAATATASAASATTAAAPGDLNAAANVFLVEQMERCETDIGDFFIAESDCLSRCIVRLLLHVRGRHGRCGCASHQRESQSGRTQRRHRGLGHTLPLRSLLHPWHSSILHTCKICYRVQPADCIALARHLQDDRQSHNALCEHWFRGSY